MWQELQENCAINAPSGKLNKTAVLVILSMWSLILQWTAEPQEALWHLSVHRWEGIRLEEGLARKGGLPRVVCLHRESASRGSAYRGSACRGVCIQEVCLQGDLHPGGLPTGEGFASKGEGSTLEKGGCTESLGTRKAGNMHPTLMLSCLVKITGNAHHVCKYMSVSQAHTSVPSCPLFQF